MKIDFGTIQSAVEEHPIIVSLLKGAAVGIVYFGIDVVKNKFGISGDGLSIDLGKGFSFGPNTGTGKTYYDYACERERYAHEERMARINKQI